MLPEMLVKFSLPFYFPSFEKELSISVPNDPDSKILRKQKENNLATQDGKCRASLILICSPSLTSILLTERLQKPLNSLKMEFCVALMDSFFFFCFPIKNITPEPKTIINRPGEEKNTVLGSRYPGTQTCRSKPFCFGCAEGSTCFSYFQQFHPWKSQAFLHGEPDTKSEELGFRPDLHTSLVTALSPTLAY